MEEAIAKYGKPVIFNSDHGSQFTSFAFTKVLRDNGIRISMDGRYRWMDKGKRQAKKPLSVARPLGTTSFVTIQIVNKQ